MPFVQAKCPECGGMLAVDDSKKAANCQFCGEAFIVQEAVNNYNTYNVTNNNTTHNYGEGSIVNVFEFETKDFIIEAGVLKKYVGSSDVIIIPDEVKIIGDYCFASMPIVEVKLHNNIIRIGNGAFSNCTHLKEMVIPASVNSIGELCFFGSSLEKIVFEDNVDELQNHLHHYYFGPGNEYYETVGVFRDCHKLKIVLFSENQKNIPACCFYKQEFEELFVPKTCTIFNDSFENCYLNRIVLENNSKLNIDLISKITIANLIIKNFDDLDFSILNKLEVNHVLIDSDTEDAEEQFSMINKVKKELKKQNVEIKTNKTKDFVIWKLNHKCQYCGGDWTDPLFGKRKCKKCGRKKDYEFVY